VTIRVFLADDHAVVRDGLRSLLEAETDMVVAGTAANGREAFQWVQKLKPDVVIMDIAMPELNGTEATRKILEALPDTLVIMLSMHSSREHIQRALHSGARGYLLKESAGSELVQAVRTVFAGSRYLSQSVSESILEDYLSQHTSVLKASPLDWLSRREREILQLVVEGHSSVRIAERLSLSPKTVETYRSRILQKLKISDLPGLVKFAIRHGIISLEL
jgi:DNA-binding NarL/FixJ family response regulator